MSTTSAVAARPTPTVALPAGPLARLLSGLCRQGPTPEPVKVAKGWSTFRWRGLDGDEATLELRTAEHPEHTEADDQAAAALARATTAPRAAVELAAILARMVELDGADGQWRWARVTELLHGARTKTDRHNPVVQGWLALLERARWRLRPGRSGRPLVDGQAIVTLERHTRCSATVRLQAAVARQLAAECREVLATTLELVAPVPNPEGNHPSRAVRGRARLAAIFATDASTESLQIDELMARYGGLDLAPVTRRRHTPGWTDHVLEELTAGLRAIGQHLAQVPQRARRALATVVHFVCSGAPAGKSGAPLPQSAPRPVASPVGRRSAVRSSRAP